jgi:hypothetical protein
MTMFNWIQSHWGIIATILFLASELIGEASDVKANSIFGVIRNFLKGEAKKGINSLEKDI